MQKKILKTLYSDVLHYFLPNLQILLKFYCNPLALRHQSLRLSIITINWPEICNNKPIHNSHDFVCKLNIARAHLRKDENPLPLDRQWWFIGISWFFVVAKPTTLCHHILTSVVRELNLAAIKYSSRVLNLVILFGSHIVKSDGRWRKPHLETHGNTWKYMRIVFFISMVFDAGSAVRDNRAVVFDPIVGFICKIEDYTVGGYWNMYTIYCNPVLG